MCCKAALDKTKRWTCIFVGDDGHYKPNNVFLCAGLLARNVTLYAHIAFGGQMARLCYSKLVQELRHSIAYSYLD